jgi:ubiquinone/menaquinone biosynthesis C-methylase UbiE
MAQSIEEIQSIELALWDVHKNEDWLANLSNKLSELRWLMPKFKSYDQQFRNATTVLELGAGEGWSSCVVKRLYPTLHVIATDMSDAAISGIGKWERIFESSVDTSFSGKSYSIPLPDNSIDLIFSFQAAHHFRLHRETLKEVARLLKPGGVCMYLHEPSCRKYIHPLAKWRVNKKRPECPEDLVVLEDMRNIAADLGFKIKVIYSTATVNRGVIEGVYYKALSMFPALCQWVPCTADFIFTKS